MASAVEGDTALGPLNEELKFFIAHLPFHARPHDIREHFSVSPSSALVLFRLGTPFHIFRRGLGGPSFFPVPTPDFRDREFRKARF